MGKARNLARLIVDSSGDVDVSSLGNVPPSDDASALTTGTLPAERIADGSLAMAKLSTTGSAGSGTFLRGDGSWQAISTTPTTDQVLNATASASVGAVGTYAMLVKIGTRGTNPGAIGAGGTVAGSLMGYAGAHISSPNQYSGSPAGTWRCMGFANIGSYSDYGTVYYRLATLYLRIA